MDARSFQSHDQPTAGYIPQEIFPNILSRLPVKPLMRFRRVSKSWRALIDSQEFIELHLNQSLETNSNFLVVLENQSLYSIDLDTVEAKKLDQPFNPESYGVELLGSCNGLLFLVITNELKQPVNIVIWNPSIGKYRKYLLPAEDILRDFCGFGYDPVGDEYKFIFISQFYDQHNLIDIDIKIYGTKSNTWRRIQDFPYIPILDSNRGVIVNGALHWIVREKKSDNNSNLIAAFNMATEECNLVPQPEYEDSNTTVADFQVIEGCLALICRCSLERIDIWVMKEYGARDSWTRLSSVPYWSSFRDLTPIAYSKTKDHDILCIQLIVMVGPVSLWLYGCVYNYVLVWYNTEKKSVTNVEIRDVPKFQYSHMCVESLVQFPGSVSGGV